MLVDVSLENNNKKAVEMLVSLPHMSGLFQRTGLSRAQPPLAGVFYGVA